MIYNNQFKRDALLEKMPTYYEGQPSRVLAFINLCIFPHKFELVFSNLREQERITKITYGCMKGVITGLLVLINRQHKDSAFSVDEYVIDFISFIKGDRVGDPVKFLLSMRHYMVRYMFLKGLQVSFGIDWRRFIADALDLPKLPSSTNYHSICTNKYVRNLLRVYVVWKNFREPNDEEYVLGVNDVRTLMANAATFKTSISPVQLQALFEHLSLALPSWNYSTRRKVAWAIDTSQDGWGILNRQFTDYKAKLVGV